MFSTPRPTVRQSALMARADTLILPWLLCVGCLDDGARDLDAFLVDPVYLASQQDAASPPDAAGPDAGGQCSTPGMELGRHVRFENQSAQSVTLIWVMADCREQRWFEMPPGASLEQDTFIGHVWRARLANGLQVFEVRIAEDTPPVVSVGGPQ